MTSGETDAVCLANHVFIAHYGFVKTAAYWAVPFGQLAEDIVHEVYIEFIKGAGHWDLLTDVRPLLTKITKNIALKLWHRHIRNSPGALHKIALFVQAKESDTEEIPDFEEKLAALSICLGKMPHEERRLIELHYFEGVSIESIAQNMQIKPSTVRQKICRLRKILQSCIVKTLQKIPAQEIHD